jgi:hypothetical protein
MAAPIVEAAGGAFESKANTWLDASADTILAELELLDGCDRVSSLRHKHGPLLD